MPTYEYRCASCGEHVEVFQSFSDDPLSECGICGGELRRVFHPVGIVFKGSGFYSTDSKRGSSLSTSTSGDSSKAPVESQASKPQAERSEGTGVAATGSGGAESASGQEARTA